MKYLSLFILLTSFVSIITTPIGVVDYFFLLISALLTLHIIHTNKLTKNLAKYIVLISFWASVVMMPVYHLVQQYGSKILTPADYEHVLSWGAMVFFISSLSYYVVCFEDRPSLIVQKIKNRHYSPRNISLSIVYISFGFLFLLTAFCYSIGLGKMGADAVVLPFHLGGTINIFRNTFVPIMFAIIIENLIMRNIKVPRLLFFLFILWSAFESIAWLSKGIIIVYLLPVGTVLYLYYRPSFKRVLSNIMPIVFVFLFMFPVISSMRNLDNGGNILENILIAKSESEKEDINNPLLRPINRIFLTAGHYAYDYKYINNGSLFDFSRAQSILLMGGSPNYQTFALENFSIGINHSSGTTGLMDPLLHGGRGLCYITIIILMILASKTDHLYLERKYSIFFIFSYILLNFCLTANISAFYSRVGLQTFLIQFLCVLFAYRLNYSKKKIEFKKKRASNVLAKQITQRVLGNVKVM